MTQKASLTHKWKKEMFFSIGDHSPLMVPEITTMYTFIYIDLKTTHFHKGKTWNYINENSLCTKYNMQIKYLNIKWLHNLQ